MLRIVVDHPHSHLALRLWRRLTTLIGALLLVVGLTASIPAIPATIAVVGLGMGWLTADDTDPEPLPDDLPIRPIVLTWAITAPLAIVGMRSGLRLLRRHRTLILFLRRFGYDDAQSAVTFAVLQTIGASWRVVTLDDAEMVPIGVAEATRRVFSVGRVTSKWVLLAGQFIGLRLFPYLIWAMCGVIALALARPALDLAQTGVPDWERWIRALDPYFRIAASVFDRRPPLEFIGPTLPGVFAVLAMAAAVSFLVLMATMAVLLAALPLSTVLFFLSSASESIQEAEQSKAVAVKSLNDIRVAAANIANRSHKVFGARLVVIKVASHVWREAVSELAALSALPLIDISEPTQNVLWEIGELTRRFGDKCVFIGRHERVTELAALPQDGTTRSIEHQLAEMLDDRDVLTYTTDRRGLRRFARALRGVLLTRHG